MKSVAIKPIAVFAALVLSSVADAATYTAHYDYVAKPALADAAIDAMAAFSWRPPSDESWSGRQAPSFGSGELQIRNADRQFGRQSQ